MQIVPSKGKLNFSKELFVDNTPINMMKIISFDTDYFRGLPINIVDLPNYIPSGGIDGMEQNNIVQSATEKDGLGLGYGFPAITFRFGHHAEAMIQWVFETEKDRDEEYQNIIDTITKPMM